MRLRLDDYGVQVFERWCDLPTTSPQDVQIVSQVLLEIGEQQGWQDHWDNYRDPADRNIIVVRPRAGLEMHVVRWTGDQVDEFSLARIASEEELEPGGG